MNLCSDVKNKIEIVLIEKGYKVQFILWYRICNVSYLVVKQKIFILKYPPCLVKASENLHKSNYRVYKFPTFRISDIK